MVSTFTLCHEDKRMVNNSKTCRAAAEYYAALLAIKDMESHRPYHPGIDAEKGSGLH